MSSISADPIQFFRMLLNSSNLHGYKSDLDRDSENNKEENIQRPKPKLESFKPRVKNPMLNNKTQTETQTRVEIEGEEEEEKHKPRPRLTSPATWTKKTKSKQELLVPRENYFIQSVLENEMVSGYRFHYDNSIMSSKRKTHVYQLILRFVFECQNHHEWKAKSGCEIRFYKNHSPPVWCLGVQPQVCNKCRSENTISFAKNLDINQRDIIAGHLFTIFQDRHRQKYNYFSKRKSKIYHPIDSAFSHTTKNAREGEINQILNRSHPNHEKIIQDLIKEQNCEDILKDLIEDEKKRLVDNQVTIDQDIPVTTTTTTTG